ncbi:hypothetical protein [Streptomyces sp. NPDC046925]|uniref:hypothetical protein n=1 Tax=Streptomyces sp. NPDC046925 TaxID=3155375 RepID=UPI0033F2BA11
MTITDRPADVRVFGPPYIPRWPMTFPEVYFCAGCGRAASAGEQWGYIEGVSHCGPCCDKEEGKRT